MTRSHGDLVQTWGDLDWQSGPECIRKQIQQKISKGLSINKIEMRMSRWDDTVYGQKPFTLLDLVREHQIHSGTDFSSWQRVIDALVMCGAKSVLDLSVDVRQGAMEQSHRSYLRQQMLSFRLQANHIQQLLTRGTDERNQKAEQLNSKLYRAFQKTKG